MSRKNIFPALISFMAVVEVTLAAARTSYKAAVYAHAPIIPPYTPVSIGREKALGNMEKNLAVYRLQATEAKNQGADILVLPEDGLYGTNFTREAIYPYLEYIPDPEKTSSLPCEDPNPRPGSEVQRALSCMARDNSIYLVADMGDKQPCVPNLQVTCPTDGRFQYNTAVAYGPDGRLLAKYHKTNLYYESQFDYPVPEAKYFDTPFGRFGLLVCFDLLFSDPLFPALFKHKVDNIAFPTAWMDSLPLLSAVGYHSSIARGFGVNLLSSNLHRPELRFQGSGVFTPEGMASFYYNNTPGSKPRLLVSEVKVIGPLSREQYANNWKGHEGDRGDLPLENENNTHISHFNESGFLEEHPRKIRNTSRRRRSCFNSQRFVQNFSQLYTTSSRLAYDTSRFDNENYTFVPLTGSSRTAHVCRNEVCCHLEYAMFPDAERQELFVLGAFDGVFHGKYYFQVCTVLKCPTLDRSTCGSFTFDSWTKFTTLKLRGKINTDYVFPQLILSRNSQLQLAEAGQWMFRNKTLIISPALDTPVLSATLLGRVYDLDPKSNIH